MINKTIVYYMGDELVEVPTGKRVSLDTKDLSPRENIYIENFLQYTVSVSAEGQGTVSGGGNFNVGDTASVSATPDEMYDFSGWYVNEIKVSDSSTYSFTVSQDITLVAIFESAVRSIGGRIYYVDTSATGGVYHFYDANGTELTTHTVEGLSNAVYCDVESKASKDKFYVYATEDGSPLGNILISDHGRWGSTGYNENTENTRGSGKTNTAKLISIFGDSSAFVWYWLKGLRDQNKNGCNDWFIGSMVELDDLRIGSTSGKSIFSIGEYIWSSVEYNKDYAYYWNTDKWTNTLKSEIPLVVCALRSF